MQKRSSATLQINSGSEVQEYDAVVDEERTMRQEAGAGVGGGRHRDNDMDAAALQLELGDKPLAVHAPDAPAGVPRPLPRLGRSLLQLRRKAPLKRVLQ